MYQEALSIDPNFVNSYVGIGNDYLGMGKTEQARTAFAKVAAHARNTGERRLARFWNAASYVHEGATDKAIDELKAGYALAEAEHDAGTMSGDLVQMGDVLREANRPDEALATAGYNDPPEAYGPFSFAATTLVMQTMKNRPRIAPRSPQDWPM